MTCNVTNCLDIPNILAISLCRYPIISKSNISCLCSSIRFLSFLIRLLSGAKIKDVTSGFRACSKPLTAYYAKNYAQDYPEPEALISAVISGYSVGEVPVVMQERQGGVSSIHALQGAYYMLKVSLSLIVYRIILSRGEGKR